MDKEQHIDTQGGSFIAGDAKTGGGDFAGRDTETTGDAIDGGSERARNVATGKDINQTENKFAGPVTIYNAPSIAEERDAPRLGDLMPSVEAELRSEIKELTRAVIRLEASVDKNNVITTQQVEAIKNQSVALEKKFDERIASMNAAVTARPFPGWMGYAGLVLLAFIAVLLLWGMFFLTRGGI